MIATPILFLCVLIALVAMFALGCIIGVRYERSHWERITGWSEPPRGEWWGRRG